MVVSPKAAGKSPQTRQLVDYLVSVLGGRQIFLYEARSNKYQEIDLATLEFKTGESCSSACRLVTQSEVKSDTDGNQWFGPFLVEQL